MTNNTTTFNTEFKFTNTTNAMAFCKVARFSTINAVLQPGHLTVKCFDINRFQFDNMVHLHTVAEQTNNATINMTNEKAFIAKGYAQINESIKVMEQAAKDLHVNTSVDKAVNVTKTVGLVALGASIITAKASWGMGKAIAQAAAAAGKAGVAAYKQAR